MPSVPSGYPNVLVPGNEYVLAHKLPVCSPLNPQWWLIANSSLDDADVEMNRESLNSTNALPPGASM